ncbi:MAG: hypothetical protein QOE46_1225 [Acidobacteriota bacterium]|jgi:hypothetical protein|nr:hypothetical protein [Acidobacteriota bacterium]
MSGDYAADINDTVAIHCNTIRAAKSVFEATQCLSLKAQS